MQIDNSFDDWVPFGIRRETTGLAGVCIPRIYFSHSAARLNAKSPTRVFECDSERKRQGATDVIRAIVDRVAMPYYRQLQLIPNARRGVEKCSTI